LLSQRGPIGGEDARPAGSDGDVRRGALRERAPVRRHGLERPARGLGGSGYVIGARGGPRAGGGRGGGIKELAKSSREGGERGAARVRVERVHSGRVGGVKRDEDDERVQR
jgi:hypothetical protein